MHTFRFPTPVAVAALTMLIACRGDSPAVRMRAIAPRAPRTVEARLSGFAWSPMHVQRSGRGAGPIDPARLELAGAAGEVIDHDPRGHDAGVGYLVIDRDADAVEALQEAARKSPGDALVWNDLAAARYTLAARADRPYELPGALAAADRALRINPELTDALFNRALIIERLGIREAARRAWQRYLQTDGTSKWADEALQHLGRLDVVNTRAQFERDLARARAALASGNADALAALTRTFPQEARTWGEGVLLAEWADAVRAGNAPRAASALAAAREIGHALAEANQERLLSDAVAAIDAAQNDATRTKVLSEAHAAYREGRVAYSRRRIAEAQQLLRRAAELFAKGSSPMARMAGYYAANASFDQNRVAEARAALESVRGGIDRQRYRALDAQIAWELALCDASTGGWGAALRNVDEATRAFTALDETQNRASVGLLMASVLDHVAQPRAAWRMRIGAFEALSRAGNAESIRNALASAIRSEASRGNFDSALAISAVALEELHGERRPIVIALGYANRARLLAEAGDLTGARQAIVSAREAVAAIPDVSVRARGAIVTDIAEASVARSTDTRRALALLGSAIDFAGTHDARNLLPDIYLQRGRAFAAAGDLDAALADFDAGTRELDVQRATVSDPEMRSSFYDIEPDLFAERVALLLRRNDVGAAFAVADAARARSFYEQWGTAAQPAQTLMADLQRALPPHAAVLEYSLLGDSLAVFYLRHDRIGVEVVKAEPAALHRSVAAFHDLLQTRGDIAAVQRSAAEIYDLLVGPVARQLAGVDRLIIVPDRDLHAVPFAALFSAATKRYLVEDFSISVAPTAALLLRAAPAAPPPAAALIIGAPQTDTGPALPDAAREAQAIAGMYDAATLLVGERATRARFLTLAQQSGVIHYAGHAQSDSGTSYAALRLASDGSGKSGDLDIADIAALQLRNRPLVLLAACGTIRGDSEHVEGMPSVARAFLTAGARGVVGTLWEIDDDVAAPLFRAVHQHLRAGEPPAAALRHAQLDLAHSSNPRLQHPSAWATVEILGNAN